MSDYYDKARDMDIDDVARLLKWRDKRLHAETRASYWLAEHNRLNEGGFKSAKTALRKAQYWLDRLNKLDGLGNGGAA